MSRGKKSSGKKVEIHSSFEVWNNVVESADNVGMDNKKEVEYKAFVKDAWEKAVNHKKGEVIPEDEFIISKSNNNYRHTINAQRIKHIFDRHGNQKKEKKQGQIAITEKDFSVIPDMIDNPSFIIDKIKVKGGYHILFGKNIYKANTYIYVEQLSKKKKRNAGVTFYNRDGYKTAEQTFEIMRSSKEYDLSEAEIINWGGGGGYPPYSNGLVTKGAVAKSANPSDTPIIAYSRKNVKPEFARICRILKIILHFPLM
jgi:uncharacterized protein YjhX (UPF0386 family)